MPPGAARTAGNGAAQSILRPGGMFNGRWESSICSSSRVPPQGQRPSCWLSARDGDGGWKRATREERRVEKEKGGAGIEE